MSVRTPPDPWDPERRALEARRRTLERRLGRIGADRRHQALPLESDAEEQAIQRENDEVLDALDGAGHRELAEVCDALARLDAGTYGTCAGCGDPIERERLHALPTATNCAFCAR